MTRKEWGTDDSDDDEEATGDATANFEASLAMATSKRDKMAGSDDESDGGVMVIDEAEDAEVKEKDDKKKKKKKLKGLPMFASMEDYADMMSDSE